MTDIKQIIENRDFAALMALDEDGVDEILRKLVYDRFCGMPIEALNRDQLDLFLIERLEDDCQADDLRTQTEDEELFFRTKAAHDALVRFNALITASALKEYIDMMPEGTFEKRVMPDWKTWFLREDNDEKIKKLDRIISDYPDGNPAALLMKYIRSHPDFAKNILT